MPDKENLLIKTKNSVLAVVFITALFSLGYAIIRYNIFGLVPWKDLPFYIMNKAISFTAIILFTISPCFKSQSKTIIIEISNSLITIHVLMSLMLFKPEIFSKFFDEDGTISLFGGLSMLAGIISFVFLGSLILNSLANKENSKTLITLPNILNVVVIFILMHLFFMGYKGWITPEKWQGGMPPISLIAFIISSFGLLLKTFRKFSRKAKQVEEMIVKSESLMRVEINN